MKDHILVVLFMSIAFLSQAQILPVGNSKDELKEHKVKKVETLYRPGQGSVFSNEHVILTKDYNSQGDLIKRYQLYLWEVVSYSYTTQYIYDSTGKLMEEIKTQKILNLCQRDQEYIRMFGKNPLNQRHFYNYTEDGLLSKKDIFNYGTQPADSTLSQSVSYLYENGVLVEKRSTSPEGKLSNHNFLITYQYDSAGHLSSETRFFGKDLDYTRVTTYSYDTDGRMIEEKTVDESFPHNNSHVKYTYNQEGHLHQKFIFDQISEEFELDITYTYDPRGNAVSGERDVTFEYDRRGLITSEKWTDLLSDETMSFFTSYEFY